MGVVLSAVRAQSEWRKLPGFVYRNAGARVPEEILPSQAKTGGFRNAGPRVLEKLLPHRRKWPGMSETCPICPQLPAELTRQVWGTPGILAVFPRIGLVVFQNAGPRVSLPTATGVPGCCSGATAACDLPALPILLPEGLAKELGWFFAAIWLIVVRKQP